MKTEMKFERKNTVFQGSLIWKNLSDVKEEKEAIRQRKHIS